jgi:hypothetical protein
MKMHGPSYKNAAYVFIDSVGGLKMFPSYVSRVAGNVATLN